MNKWDNLQINTEEGLPKKLWNLALDKYLLANKINSETFMSMSDTQKNIIQEIKKSVKRLNK